MRAAVLLIPGAILLGLAFSGAEGGDDETRPDELDLEPDVQAGEAQATIRAMAQALGLDQQWAAFLEAAALGESGLNPLMGRGVVQGAPPWAKINIDQGESRAAQRAYNRNADALSACGHPAEQYNFGSGGLWAQLPANFLMQFPKGSSERCLSPWAVFDPPAALAMLLGYFRGCMRRDAFKATPTWGNLRVCMRAPSRMNRAEELERQRSGKNKLGDRLEQLGYSRELVDRPVSQSLNMTAAEALAIVQGVA